MIIATDQRTSASSPARRAPSPHEEERLQILIVEDDPALRELLEVLLSEEAHHEIRTASNGLQAFEMLQAQPAEILVTDWMMEKVDGLELVQRIRATAFPDYTYILILTAKGHKRDVVRALQAGADDYLTKPFDPDELQARLAAGERRIQVEKELRAARDEAMVHSRRDSLTGVLSRAAILEQGESALALARREGGAMSVVMVDVDHLKQVNDGYGHLVGDDLLRCMAETATHGLRAGDWLGRWGGDEFLLVLPRTTLEGACVVAERIRTRIQATSLTLPDGSEHPLCVSLGVAAAIASEYPTLQTLVARADEALYRAKRAGKNQVAAWEGGGG